MENKKKISPEAAAKLKEELNRFWGSIPLQVKNIIDELTEQSEDPNMQFEGTDRLMVGDEDFKGYLINMLRQNENDLDNWCKTCTPYLSDTVEAIRLMVDEGKTLENEVGFRIKWHVGSLWIMTTQEKWIMMKYWCPHSSGTYNDALSYIFSHQWHTVNSEEE